ncbi:AMP-binding protein [Streptomyces sp. NPDC051555]|uniref:AMP-binding protein n=1 Tax=Streptomyces sp. NPDC051555 TaxID=3365657 RepID=UPI0037AB5D6F
MNPDPADSVLHHFRRWAGEDPGAPAVVSGAAVLDYGELDRGSSRLAGHLRAAGLEPGGAVAIATADRPEAVTALLAVLKAGGAYVLLDPDEPAAARRQLAQAPPFLLLTRRALLAFLDEGSDRRVICLDTEAPQIAARPVETAGVGAPAGGDPAAFVLTGGARARAVRIDHARLLAAHDGWAEVAGFTPEDRHLITARPDLGGFATGWTRALCSGGALVLPDRPSASREELRRLIRDERVSVVHTDPGSAHRLFTAGDGARDPGRTPDPDTWSVRLVTVTGDRLYLDEQTSLHALLRPGARLLNVYGPAETAGVGTWFELPMLAHPVAGPEGLSLLGVPFPGCRVELVGGEVRLTPPDGGGAVATGDLARVREDGLLEFAGRQRDRVVIGRRTLDTYRIESLLRGHPRIGGALVREVPDAALDAASGGKPGEKRHGSARGRLVAYVAPPAHAFADASSGASTEASADAELPDAGAVGRHLADALPAEEIPRTVVRLRALPRDRSGREDRGALPLPVAPGAARAARGSGKYTAAGGDVSPSCAVGCAALPLALIAASLTGILWPGSTDLGAVPSGYANLFFVLYVFEWLAFGFGVVFLLAGRRRTLGQGRGRVLGTAAHLAITYLLVSWWPQDNLYRLAAKQDWPRQAALVYAFNVPLMIAAGIVALYAVRGPRTEASAGS